MKKERDKQWADYYDQVNILDELLEEPVEFSLASISTVLEMTNGTADLGEADDKLLVAEPRHGCWGVGKF